MTSFDESTKKSHRKKLERTDLALDPTEQLLLWLTEARHGKVSEYNAMALATASKQGVPSCRMVLLKQLDQRGLVFFTNYGSRKSKELSENPFAVATFYWKEEMRQIIVEGEVTKTSLEESAIYFAKRSRESQIGAWASLQDQVLSSKEKLLCSFAEYEGKYQGHQVPLPPLWGGFRIVPYRFEFWQEGKDRLHDRFQYVRENNTWKIERLAP